MFTLVAIHDYTTLSLQLPCTSIHIEHDDIHAEVHCCLLGRETCAQTIIEENHHQGLVLAQMLIFKTLVLNLKSFGHCLV